MRVVLTLIWWLNRLKSTLMSFKGLWRPLKARKKGLKNDDMTSFSNSFYDSEFPWTEQANRLFFYGKICIRGSLEVKKTQVVCCCHPPKNYFMLNSNKISHCDIWWGNWIFKVEFSLAKLRWLFFPMKTANMVERWLWLCYRQSTLIYLAEILSLKVCILLSEPCDQTYLECFVSTLTKVDVTKICSLLRWFCHWLWEQFSHLYTYPSKTLIKINSLPQLCHK